MAGLMNLARMTSATVGTGTITLGSAITGCLSFATAAAAAGVASGATVTYGIEDGSSSEVGRGVWTSPNTLTRATILASTNGGSAINLSGTAEVYCMAAAEDFGMRLIEEKTLSGLSTVTFSAIPQNFDHLRLIVAGRSDAGSTPGVGVAMTFNGDTSAIYHYHGRQIVNAAEGDNLDDATTSVPMGIIPWSAATAGLKGSADVLIVDYADTNLFKTGFFSRHSIGATTIGGSWVTSYANGFDYGSAAAITSLTLALAAGNGVAGSAAWLYGIR